MANLLELECPGCGERLQLDPGFAGGVCRCSVCGTLMTVPADPLAQPAERLSRPDSPGGRPSAPAPSSRPASPVTDASDDDDSDYSVPELIEEEQQDTGTAYADDGAADNADENTYVTDTGRVIRLDEDYVIPTAKKRKVVRATTAVAFFAVVGGILALMGFAIYLMVKPEPKLDTSHIAMQTFEYDRDASPWTLDKPNAMGLPLGGSSVIIVDASKESRDWLGDVKSALVSGLTRADSKAQVNLIYANEDGIDTLYGGLRAIGGLSQSKLKSFQEPFKSAGRPDMVPAFVEAVDQAPEHVILITARRARHMNDDRLRELLDASKLQLHVIDLIDDPGLESMAEDTGGQHQFISTFTIDAWDRE